MASSAFGFNFEFVKSIYGFKGPLIKLLPFQSGGSQLITPGQAIVLSAGNFVPLAADQAMSSVLAVSVKRITASHLAGYYPAIIPRPGDVFKATLATAAAATRGSSVYVTDSTQALATSGTNVLGSIWDTPGYPQEQGNADVGDVVDRGTTVASAAWVEILFKSSVSYLNALQL